MFLNQTELIGVTDESMPCLEAPACKSSKLFVRWPEGGLTRLTGIIIASLNSTPSCLSQCMYYELDAAHAFGMHRLLIVCTKAYKKSQTLADIRCRI